MTPSPAPLLMKATEIIGVKRAVDLCGKSENTIRRLSRRYGLARQTSPAAPLEISRVGLEMVLHGDFEALELLRQGRRQEPPVRRYFDFLGLPV